MKVAIILTLIVLLGFMLRTFQITKNPPSTYWDEAAIGYNAYSILKTGHDEWGKSYPILFRSFDDYKLPIYIYSVAAFEKFLGPSDLAIRLPAAISGGLTVLFFFFMTRELLLLDRQKSEAISRNKIGLIASLVLAIAPWHIQFTRAGFESGLALFFVVLGTWLLLLSFRKNIWFLFPSLLIYTISTMTYHNVRVFLPLFSLVVLLVFWKKILANWKPILVIVLLTSLINLPILSTWFSSEGRARLTSQSILHQPGDLVSNIQINYAANFGFDYLFFHGDQDGRHSVKKMGELFAWQLPILLLGIIILLKRKTKLAGLIFGWFLLSPIPAAITNVSPHALRGLLMIIPLSFLTAYGIFQLNKRFSPSALLLCPIVVYSLFFYVHLYYFFYPKYYSDDWQDGYRSAAQYLGSVQKSYDQIFIHGELPPIYLLFYTSFPPEILHRQNHNLNSFGKFNYFSEYDEPPKKNPGKTDLIMAYYVAVPKEKKILKEIRKINGDPFFKIYEF